MASASTNDDPISQLMEAQAKQAQLFFGQLLPGTGSSMPDPGNMDHWAEVAGKLQGMWDDFRTSNPVANALPDTLATNPLAAMFDPAQWGAFAKNWYAQMPLADPSQQQKLWDDSVALWKSVLGQYAIVTDGGLDGKQQPELPLKDHRFADPRWQQQPIFALIHQTYLMLAERIGAMVDDIEGIDEDKRQQLRFATRTMVEALSPANFPVTNPIVLERTLESRGENLVKGMEHLLSDLKRGQLTHTDSKAFKLGENIAVTPGKVVHETPLYQLIQYSPTTDKVLETPLVIFPPWINRYYILDLNPKKSFVRWATEQGVTTFVVSWKSADSSMKDVIWDDYIRAQMDAIDHIRARLKVPAVHAIGYCVSGTTLAATLAILSRRGEADKVKSATFFTAQVDFEKAGELLHFVDDTQIAAIKHISPDGYLDGRIMAATFNLLRGTDLIWNYVVNNYLMGEEYPAFDLLHWNSDVTNLPTKWHQSYLTDLYRDNRLVEADSLSADGTPIDLSLVVNPCYIQAGKEDHIAPPESVWRVMDHFSGPMRFVLAGSGHIAGVVNPPEANKYQYWLNDGDVSSFEEFVSGAVEHKGSWWPDWVEWLKAQDSKTVAATGRRNPGAKGDKVIEDAPGRYVTTR